MALPITVPFTFGNATTTQSLSSLDVDFATITNAINGIGNGSVSLNNVSSVNVTATNITTGNITVTSGNISFSNITSTNINSVNITSTNINSANATVTNLTATNLNTGPWAGFRNRIINGNFSIWQRGTSIPITTHLQRTADMWNIDWNGSSLGTLTASQLIYGPGSWFTAPTLPQTVVYLNRTSSGTGNTFLDFSTQLESVNTYQGQTITISGWCVGDAGKTFLVKTEQFFGSGGSPSASAFTISSPITFNGNWQQFSFTTTLASTVGKTLGSSGNDTLNVILSLPPNDAFVIYFANVQCELGSVATPFEYRPLTIEQQLCYRYYVGSVYVSIGTVINNATSIQTLSWPSTMRTSPTVTSSSTYTVNVSSFAASVVTDKGGRVVLSSTTGGVGEWDGYLYLNSDF